VPVFSFQKEGKMLSKLDLDADGNPLDDILQQTGKGLSR
jgi:hypothetical protein